MDRRSSLEKPLSAAVVPGQRRKSKNGRPGDIANLLQIPSQLLAHGKDPSYVKQGMIDRLVEAGQELMWKKQFKEAAEVLEKSFEILTGVHTLVIPEPEPPEESEEEFSRRGSNDSQVVEDRQLLHARSGLAEEAKLLQRRMPTKPTPTDAGPTVQALLLVYSRGNEWQKVLDCANEALLVYSRANEWQKENDRVYSGLQGEHELFIGDPSMLLDILHRRAVALTHLAGPSKDEPHRLPDAGKLALAEIDLLEVQKRRPTNDAIRRGLQHVIFLKTQTAAVIPMPPPIGSEVTGLARLRAMEV